MSGGVLSMKERVRRDGKDMQPDRCEQLSLGLLVSSGGVVDVGSRPCNDSLPSWD